MIRHHVPRALTVPGAPSAPRRNEPRCAVCRMAYSAHTGQTCAICRHPVEHHQDRAAMVAEIAACAELSRARLEADLHTRPHEDWCINQAPVLLAQEAAA